MTDFGVEGFMVASLAETFGKGQKENKSLSLQVPFNIMQECLPPKVAHSPSQGGNGIRCIDMALFNGNRQTFCVIEVK